VGVNGVDFMVCNTDAQALYHSPVANKVQLGASLTEGLGAGADPEIGRQAAVESIDEIQSILETGTKMCFITAGMGGGTGTGAAPIIAKAARDMGILTVGIVTSPFGFEGKIRKAQSEEGIKAMREAVDSLIVINNDKLRQVYGDLGFRNAFAKADEVLAGAAKGIAEVITNHYTQNIDLRDAKTVLENSGSALFGTGEGEGPDRAVTAIGAALDSPLLNDNHIKGAKNILLLLTSGSGEHEITIDEIGEITDHIQREAGGNANVIMGIGDAEEVGSKITCTIIATGFPTGTRVLPTDKVEVVKYDLESQDTPAVVAVEVPSAKVELDTQEPTLEMEERVVMDLGEAEEEEAPVFAAEQETPGAEVEEDFETEAEFQQEDPMVGFPQMPEEDHEERFEGTIQENAFIDEEPTVHVLEWDMEDEEEEVQERIVAAEEMSILPVNEEIEEPETESEAFDQDAQQLSGGWDLFSTVDSSEEEEMELTFVDDTDEEAQSTEVAHAMETQEEVEYEFDAPAPAQMERSTGMIESKQEEFPQALEAPLSEDLDQDSEGAAFTLDDIEGDGFTLEFDNEETTFEQDEDEPEERDYDPFDMSLSEMPDLKMKADMEGVESSFKLPSSEFDLKPQASVDPTEVDTLDDPELRFEIKETAQTYEEETETSLDVDMDLPIAHLPKRTAQELPSKIQERMNRLQKFGYRFKENLTEVERTPAYKRQGLDFDLEQKSAQTPSNLGVDSEGNIRTNNSFLHDNVD
jgi:cell division protein FtsZ